jgi:hypothetical protein
LSGDCWTPTVDAVDAAIAGMRRCCIMYATSLTSDTPAATSISAAADFW